MTHEILTNISSFEMNDEGLFVCLTHESGVWCNEERRFIKRLSRYRVPFPEEELPNLHIGQPVTITFKTEEE